MDSSKPDFGPLNHYRRILRQHFLELQGYRCAICASDKPNSKGTGVWQIDHCHRTGMIRGVLDARCNTILGRYDDDLWQCSMRLGDSALRYLQKPPTGLPFTPPLLCPSFTNRHLDDSSQVA